MSALRRGGRSRMPALGHKPTDRLMSRQVSYGPILLQKSAAMDLAAGPFVEPRSEALALTHFTQLRRYATRCAEPEPVAVVRPAMQIASDSGRWRLEQTHPGHLAGRAIGADQASGCASSVRTSSRSSCADAERARSPRCQRTTGRRPGRAHVCRAGSCAMVLLDSTAV